MSWYYEVIAPEKWLTRAVKGEASVGEERKCCAGRRPLIYTHAIPARLSTTQLKIPIL